MISFGNMILKMDPSRQKVMLIINAILLFLILCGVLFVMVEPLLKVNTEEKKDFELICETKSTAGNIPVLKYKSRRTGLHVVIAKIEGPIVQGFFTIATEAHDEDGLPHTLEHLVFLGSEEYPYKGVLDLLANRCLAEGTNAWTDTDHTAYTIETASSEGFLNLLPIYLDHLLYPTLTDAGFITEVYHITGDGEDAGVVYSEIQARENTGPDLTYDAMIRVLYPEPSGYHYQTGGLMANLRNGTTTEKIRNFHKAMYRPENLHVIITGQIEPQDVFLALKPIEDKIISKGDRGHFQRPWESPVPPFTKDADLEVVYPSDNEDTGIVRVGWRGPSIITNIMEYHSMEVLLKYLTEHSVSPLQSVFIENEDPLASFVSDYMLRNSVSSCTLSFYGVPKHKVREIKPLLIDTLRKIVLEEVPFDAEVMLNILNNLIHQEQNYLEHSPHEVISQYIINDLLYGHTCEDLAKELNKITWYEHLLTEPPSYWLNLIEKYLLSAPAVVILGIPSEDEAERLQQKEEARYEARLKELGDEGLNKWAEKVEEAKEINEIPPPDEMLESIPVPSTDRFNFHSLRTYSNIHSHHSGLIGKPDPDLFHLYEVPVRMQLDDIKTNFVKIIAILDTQSLSTRDRLYLPLLLDLLLESPILKNGEEIPYEDVVKRINADLLIAASFKGLSLRSSHFSYGDFFHNVGISFETEMGKYAEAVGWLSDILFRVNLTPGRILVKATKLLNSIGDKKREADAMVTLMAAGVLFKEDTNINKANVLRQEKFLTNVLETVRTTPEKVLEELYNVYRNITRLEKITVHMATNLEKLAARTNVTRPWTSFSPEGHFTTDWNLDIVSDHEERMRYDKNENVTGYIAGIGSVESAYLVQITPSIGNYFHSDLPALMVAISYLTQLEGPMWKQIRGKGLAYRYVLALKPSEGALFLKLGRAAQLSSAYNEAINIIKSYLNGTASFNRILLESGRSSLIYDIIQREAEIADVVQQSIYAYYRKVPHDYNKSLLKVVEKISLADVQKVFHKYFRPLVDPEESRTVVVCPTQKVQEIQTSLNEMGHRMEAIPSLEHSRFSNL